MPGRPRKPTKILKTQGTARKDRHAKRQDLELGGDLPQPPSFLNGEALTEWVRVCSIGKYSKALSHADRGPLTMYCLLWAELCKHAEAGSEMQTSRMNNFATVAGKFGMTPSDRAKIQLPEDEKPKNKFAALSEDELSGPGASIQ